MGPIREVRATRYEIQSYETGRIGSFAYIVVMIAVSYQISLGLALGFVSFALMKLLLDRRREIHPAVWLIAGLSLAFLAIRWWPA